jgi:hypothetical protein
MQVTSALVMALLALHWQSPGLVLVAAAFLLFDAVYAAHYNKIHIARAMPEEWSRYKAAVPDWRVRWRPYRPGLPLVIANTGDEARGRVARVLAVDPGVRVRRRRAAGFSRLVSSAPKPEFATRASPRWRACSSDDRCPGRSSHGACASRSFSRRCRSSPTSPSPVAATADAFAWSRTGRAASTIRCGGDRCLPDARSVGTAERKVGRDVHHGCFVAPENAHAPSSRSFRPARHCRHCALDGACNSRLPRRDCSITCRQPDGVHEIQGPESEGRAAPRAAALGSRARLPPEAAALAKPPGAGACDRAAHRLELRFPAIRPPASGRRRR